MAIIKTLPFTVTLPFPGHCLSPNKKQHPMQLHRARKAYKTHAGQELVAQGIRRIKHDGSPITVSMRFVPPGNFPYDRDNLTSRMKSGLDAIAHAIGVDDYLFRPQPPILDPAEGRKAARVEVTLSREVEHDS
ncbi:phage endonuclease [Thioclava dalianensis]|uniref:Phage endonuclease n=1 Tax=Thioclava dalianensis TaxID=1185766 RepID=A0A074TAU3_9RHOB|nr:hypothetical protein [Thioclava dalianensis]KEP68799.1 phage endonuclease [Thioclava dalianensis]SFN49343.1 crossover junction endodeoxyribonuclease RusA [Thioclava dalianensis]